jgi:hypothetical protein
MSIFDSIRDAIFRHGGSAPGTPAARSAPPVSAPPPRAQTSAPSPPTAPKPANPAPSSAPAAAPAAVDIETTLDKLASQNGQKLNWRTSIVDLMKLLDLDSSLEHRKQLAKELGYTGNPQDSASLNIWLHKEVMAKLAANGGKVPATLQ